MSEFTSFSAPNVRPAELSTILTEYLALERARVYRRRLIKQWGLLAVAIALIGIVFQWLWLSLSATALLLPPAFAWIAELQCERDLARRLEEVPGVTLHGAELSVGSEAQAIERPAS